MMESKSDYLHSLNRKLSDLFHNLPNHDQPNPTNPTMSVYSPLRKTERHRDIAAANSRGHAKPEDKNLNESQSSRSSKGVILNVSQLDNADHDRFFENFDKIFRVHQSAGSESVDLEEAMKKKNICRVLLDDFEPGRLSPTMGYTNDLFHPERSLTGFTNKEKVLPKLEHVSSKPYLGVKTEPSMSDIAVPYKTADYKETSKEPVCERVKFEFPTSKPVKDKLPDLKVPKAVINKLNSTGGEIPLKSYENKVHNNVKAIGKVRVNVQAHEGVNVKNKNSHQALEKIVKPKKLTNITRSKTFVLVEGKDKVHDDMKARVNSIHGIDNGLKSTGASQKNDTSLDMGPGTKSKFFLKGLEQKVTHPNIYNQENVGNKTQNEVKNGRNNVTSRTYYSKENLSFLSNSSRDKAFEGNQLKMIRETGNLAGRAIESTGHGPSNFNGHTVKMGVEEISRLYKDLRQSIKLNETQTQKFTQGMRAGSNSLKPLNEEYNDNIRRG